MRWGAAAVAAFFVLGACASVTRGTSEGVTFDSDPPGAEMRSEIINICAEEGACARSKDERYAFADQIDRSNKPGPACITPCTLQIKRTDELLVTFTKPGYAPQTVKLSHQVASGGAVGVAGNAIIGGVGGVVVDSVTNAAFDHVPNPLKVTLKPLASAQPKAAERKKAKQ